ncbi:putative MFS family arabinose efflux permease [Amycolatopsis bartoniae]|uniref:MFS transporter n=1 Tax=Amycolatopsis bartoniae TaxID=941986 RepID=A0A8H9M8G0_9PSEU|nr:MFS transporter [Amycolatopsis bartoniae]MBB2937836.1 putative MFS family arabinose efflux permease [Amycolatopsis bartoniae]GHF41086.1 MFS transporter [Amycolatopsis bartoniae]
MLDKRTAIALGTLTAACFVSVTSENLPVALLPQLAAGFGVSGPAVGLLSTGYAIVVAISVVPLVALTSRWDRRSTALVTIAAVAVSNVLLALAPGYGVAVLARVVSAAGHGVFWSIVAPVATRLLGPERSGRATAVVFAGNSLAFLLGLPLSSWLGATIGWRPTVLAVAGAAALSAVVIRATVRPLPPEHSARPVIRRAVTARALAPVNLVTLVVVLGHFAAYTYVTVIIADYVHVTGSATSGLLLGYGAAGLLGLVLIGRRVDHRPRATALFVTGGAAACLLVLSTAGALSTMVAGIAVVLWAVPAGGMAVILQAAVLRVAPDRADLASAAYVVAFQIGIAAGAAIGGLCLDTGTLPAALAIAAACGLSAALVIRRSAAFPA